MPPSIFWTPCLANLRCLAVLLFLHPPTQRRRPSQMVVPSGPSSWMVQQGGPQKIPQVANGENEWFGFLGGGVGYYTQTSRILRGGFEWRSIDTHNQDPTWNIIVENPPQIGGIFWGERLHWQKCLLGGSQTMIHNMRIYSYTSKWNPEEPNFSWFR